MAGEAVSGVIAAVLGATALAAFVLTGLVRRYAAARSILDVPNQRSTHRSPIPRGGGLALAGPVLVAIGLLTLDGSLAERLGVALIGGGAAVALVGWWDDRVGLSAVARLVVQVAAAAGAVLLLDGLPRIRLGSTELALGSLGTPLAILGIVWSTNLYNFMDGIDGLAATEAIQVGFFGALVAAVNGDRELAIVAAAIGAGALGFLWWNWFPARIFLGDVGSGLLGFLFGVLAYGSERAGVVPGTIWIILLGVFGFDTTVTLVRRVLRGEWWFAPHRQHAYQRLVASGMSHARVVAGVAVLNCGLAGLAWIGASRPRTLAPIVVLAFLGLAGAYLAVERRCAAGSTGA
jgi:Fuc2NAc and GlcNAc transferase